MKTNKRQNYAFIDSQNVHLGVKKNGWLLDFSRFRILLKDKYSVEQAYIFIGFVPGNESLYADLQKAGYICIFKPTLTIRENGSSKVKGNVDAELVLNAMIELPNYEQAVIVSGDGDFHCLVEYLSKQKKLLKIIVPNSHYSSLLRKFSPYIVSLQNFRGKLEK